MGHCADRALESLAGSAVCRRPGNHGGSCSDEEGMSRSLHSHFNEQITYILEGALKFWIDGKEIVVHAGEVLTIPPHMPHKAEALEDTVDLDVFNPPRHDWISGTDAYLRR